MKHVLMILFVWSGLAISGMQAQSCSMPCPPCPPECCVTTACAPGSSAATSGTDTQSTLATCEVDLELGLCNGRKMSKKELAACLEACRTAQSGAPSDDAHVSRVGKNTAGKSCCAPAKSAAKKELRS